MQNIEELLCPFKPVEEIKEEWSYDGGIAGKIIALESKIKDLEDMISDLDIQLHKDIREEVKIHEENTPHSTQHLTTDEQFMIPLIRNEARNVAEAVVFDKLRTLRFKIECC